MWKFIKTLCQYLTVKQTADFNTVIGLKIVASFVNRNASKWDKKKGIVSAHMLIRDEYSTAKKREEAIVLYAEKMNSINSATHVDDLQRAISYCIVYLSLNCAADLIDI